MDEASSFLRQPRAKVVFGPTYGHGLVFVRQGHLGTRFSLFVSESEAHGDGGTVSRSFQATHQTQCVLASSASQERIEGVQHRHVRSIAS
eukprot:jgi/Pico_ML_1/52297/g3024.t1